MAETKLNVKLMTMTKDPVSVIYAACKQCYSPKFAGDMFEQGISGNPSLEKQENFVRRVAEAGHESPIEHVSFSFAIEGLSRTCTHQIVRHRMASYSQQSQRYVKEDDFEYVIPPKIKQDAELKALFEEGMKEAQQRYTKIVELLQARGVEGEAANQDARFLLPGAAETKIAVTMNCRELIHFFKVRCCSRTQWELREVANKMLAIVKEKLPAVFGSAGAKCEALKFCPEGEKFNCGRYPVREKVVQSG